MARAPLQSKDSEPFDWKTNLAQDRSWVRRFARRKGLSKGSVDSEDVAQATIQKALHQQSRLRFRSHGAVRGWLAKVASNFARDNGRKRRAEELDSQNALQLEAHSGTPSRIIGALEERSHVRALIAQLPERSRTVIEMRFWKEASFAEIGAAIGTTEGHVRVIFHRALQELRASGETSIS